MSVRRSNTQTEDLAWIKDISPKPSRTFNPATFIGFSNDSKKIIYYTIFYTMAGENAANMILQDVKGSTKETIPLPVLPSFIQTTSDGQRCVLFSDPEFEPFQCFEYIFDEQNFLLDAVGMDAFNEINMLNDGFFDHIDDETFESECRLSPDGRFLAVPGENKDFLLWGATGETFTNRFIVRGHSRDNTDCICNHPDEPSDSENDEDFFELDEECTVEGHEEHVTSVAFSPDKKTIATAAGAWPHIKLWEMSPDGPTLRFTVKESDVNYGDSPVFGMAFSYDGNILATAVDQAVSLWNVKEMEDLHRMEMEDPHIMEMKEPHRIEIESFGEPSIAWSPDGMYLACGTGHPTRPGEYSVSLFDTETYRLQKTLQKSIPGYTRVEGVRRLAFSPDSSMLACQYGDAEVTVWFRKHLIHSAMKRVSKNMPWRTGSFEKMTPDIWAENFIETEW